MERQFHPLVVSFILSLALSAVLGARAAPGETIFLGSPFTLPASTSATSRRTDGV